MHLYLKPKTKWEKEQSKRVIPTSSINWPQLWIQDCPRLTGSESESSSPLENFSIFAISLDVNGVVVSVSTLSFRVSFHFRFFPFIFCDSLCFLCFFFGFFLVCCLLFNEANQQIVMMPSRAVCSASLALFGTSSPSTP